MEADGSGNEEIRKAVGEHRGCVRDNFGAFGSVMRVFCWSLAGFWSNLTKGNLGFG